jgi:hypothetical protein
LTRREAFGVAATLLFVHALLFLRGLPLPHHDSFFFTEPALHLVRSGRLIAPSAEYLDLTYGLNFGAYPPLYFVLLAGWLRVFGYSPATLLAFTHLLHVVYLGLVYVLARVRFQGSLFTAALLAFSCFPLFNHGRPDLLAALLGVAAFLSLPTPDGRGKTALSIGLLALALAASPALGIGVIAAAAGFIALGPGRPNAASLRLAFLICGAGALGGLAFWACFITWQDSWWIAPFQFRVNSAVRGETLNHLPHLFELVSPAFFAFVYLPLLFAAILPAAIALLRRRDVDRHPRLWLTAAAYLIGLVPLLLINKLQLFYQHHFALAARIPLQATLLESRGRFRLLGYFATGAFTLCHFFLGKETLIYAVTGNLAYEALEAKSLAGVRTLAVDSNCAPAFFGKFDGLLLDYDIIKFNQWRAYLEKTPPEILARLPERLREGPAVPDAIVITTRGHFQMGAPNPAVFEKVSGPALTATELFGMRFRQPATPFALHVYRRRPGVPIPEAL